MKIKSNFLIILTGLTLFSCSQKIDYEAANAFILRSAQEWAEAINEGDSLVTDRIVDHTWRCVANSIQLLCS